MPQRPPGLNIQPIPLYIIPHPTPSLLSSISEIKPTWRADLLSSVPPNLQDWFIPLNNKEHWEVYKSPLFPENNGRWRFEYKTAFAHVFGCFDDDLILHFKSITGIGSKSGVEGMIDIMELIDSIEGFIDGVKALEPEPTPTPSPPSPTPTPIQSPNIPNSEQYQHLQPPPTITSRRNLRTESYFIDGRCPPNFPHDAVFQLSRSERRRPRRSTSNRPSSNFDDFFEFMRQNRHKTAQQLDQEMNEKIKALLDFGVTPRQLEQIAYDGQVNRYLELLRAGEIVMVPDHAKIDDKEPNSKSIPLIKQYSNGAIKALKTSPKKFTKAVIKSPTRIIKKCGDLLHLRRTQSIPQVGSEVGGPNHEYISDRRRNAIEKWEHDIHRKTDTWSKPPSSFIEDYEFIGRGHTLPLASPKPARPDTPIDPRFPPPPVQREPRTPMRPIHGPPGTFIGFLSDIGFPV